MKCRLGFFIEKKSEMLTWEVFLQDCLSATFLTHFKVLLQTQPCQFPSRTNLHKQVERPMNVSTQCRMTADVHCAVRRDRLIADLIYDSRGN
jgi:hypothetical protein